MIVYCFNIESGRNKCEINNNIDMYFNVMLLIYVVIINRYILKFILVIYVDIYPGKTKVFHDAARMYVTRSRTFIRLILYILRIY